MTTNQRRHDLKWRYGITQAEFDAMYEAQSGKCAICGRAEKLNVDHNHITKEFRGLLCRDCNTFLGFIEKYGPEVCALALSYLKRRVPKLVVVEPKCPERRIGFARGFQ